MMKIVPFLVVVLMLSCKEKTVPIDPCRYIEIELTVINKTDVDVLVMAILSSCDCEICGLQYLPILLTPGQTKIETLGNIGSDELDAWMGASGLYNNDAESGIIAIEEDNQKVTLQATFNGTNYHLDFI